MEINYEIIQFIHKQLLDFNNEIEFHIFCLRLKIQKLCGSILKL